MSICLPRMSQEKNVVGVNRPYVTVMWPICLQIIWREKLQGTKGKIKQCHLLDKSSGSDGATCSVALSKRVEQSGSFLECRWLTIWPFLCITVVPGFAGRFCRSCQWSVWPILKVTFQYHDLSGSSHPNWSYTSSPVLLRNESLERSIGSHGTEVTYNVLLPHEVPQAMTPGLSSARCWWRWSTLLT